MSEENLEIIRELHRAFERVGFEVVRDALLQRGDYAATIQALGGLDPGVEDDAEIKLLGSGVSLPDMPAGSTFRGPEGWLEFWRSWLEPWEDFEYEVGNFADAGDDVVHDISISARGRESGIPVNATASQVWTIRNGRIGRLLIFDTRAEALETAGLSE